MVLWATYRVFIVYFITFVYSLSFKDYFGVPDTLVLRRQFRRKS